MRLLIVSSDPDGRVTLASERFFADAAAATRELARLIGDGVVDTSAEFYTVDMDGAVPVIILQQPVVRAPQASDEAVEEPYASEVLEELEGATSAADAEVSAPVEIDVAASASAGEPEEAPEAVPDDAGLLAELAAVPEDVPADVTGETPAPLGDVDAAPQWPWDAPAVDAPAGDEDAPVADEDASADRPGDDAPVGEEAVPEPPAVAEPVAAELADLPAIEDMPLPEAVEALPDPPAMPDVAGVAFRTPEALSKEALAEGVAAFEDAPVDEPAPAPIEGLEPLEGIAEVREPLGVVPAEEPSSGADEPADAAGFADMAGVVAALAETLPEGEEPQDPDDVLSIDASFDDGVPDGLALPVAETGTEPGDPEPEAGAAAADTPGYEPGALNMTEYTCDDCVYVNTCPNQHQKQPAECGSFQWRSM